MCSVMAVKFGLSLLMLMALPVAAQIHTVYFYTFLGTITLNPNITEFIYSITWRHSGDTIVEYEAEYAHRDLEYSGIFKYRAWMNWRTGTLTIHDVRRSEGGLFTVEINGKPPVTFNAVPINKVDNYPVQVSVRPKNCSNHNSNNCTLVCGEDFKGAEPVEFFWKPGKRGEWKKGNQMLNIFFTKDTKELSYYDCKVTNPISEKTSEESDGDYESEPEEKQSPLKSSSGPIPLPAILFLAVLAVVAAGAVVVQLVKKPQIIRSLFGLRRQK